MRKTNLKVMGCIALVGCITLSIAGCNGNNVKEVESTESVTESTEVEKVKLTDKVTGIKDWTVEVNTKDVDFMNDISWDKEYVSNVTVDDSKVDLTKVGEYTLTYTVKGTLNEKETQDASVDVTEAKEIETKEPTETETTTVEVISEEDTQAKVDKGEAVTTPETTRGNTSSNSNSSNNAPVVETPKAHEHSWQPVYTTVHHDAVTHTEQQDQGHNETTTETVYVVSDGSEFKTKEDMIAYLRGVEDPYITYSVNFVSHETWIPNVVTVTVVDKEAYDEQVIDHYECSCGATK